MRQATFIGCIPFWLFAGLISGLAAPRTMAAPPTITNFTPDIGGPGTNVVITGTNFSNVTAVRFTGAGTSFTIDSPTQITAQAPPLHNNVANPSDVLITLAALNEPLVNSAEPFTLSAVGGKRFISPYSGDPDPQNWADPLHWEPNGVPVPGDSVVVDTSGTVHILGTGTTSLTKLTLLRPFFTFAGNVIVNNLMTINNASLNGGGTTTIPTNATLNLYGTSGNSLNGSTLNNSGTVHLNSGSLIYQGNVLGVVNNLNGGTFEIRDEQSVGLNGIGAFTNAGTLTKPPTVGRAQMAADFFNASTGTVVAPAGTLRFGSSNRVTGSGSYDTGLNGLIHFDSTSTFDAGTVLTGFIRSTANLHLNGDTTIGKTGKSGIFELAGGTLDGAGKLSVLNGSAFHWSGGNIDGPGEIALAAGTTLNISGGFKTVGVRTFNVAGGTAWTGNGTINTNAAFVFNNLNTPGAFFVIFGDGAMGTANGTGTGATFNNSGNLIKSGGTGTTYIGPTFTNTGNVEVAMGRLRFGNFTQTGGSTVVGNTGIATTLASDNPLNLQGGTLRGNGAINAPLNNSGGNISIGTPALTDILNVTGNYSQSAGGALNFRIGGPTVETQYDRLNLVGTATLGGALNVSLLNNYVPAIGATFTLISNDSTDAITNTFLGLPQNGLLAANNVLFRISYIGGDGNDVTLTRIAQPTLSINDITITEGTGGTSNANFTISLSFASPQIVNVGAIPANGTAKAPGDFTSTGQSFTFTPGQTTKTFSVPVVGDTLDEDNENFYVLLSSPVNASILKGRGTCTIADNDLPPTITIDDLNIGEGNSGQRTAVFSLHLSQASGKAVKVNYSTGTNSTATPNVDYVALAPTQITFNVGQTVTLARVLINGDLLNESNETFLVNLSAPINATLADSQATGTILNDDTVPALSINDVSIAEGNSGTKLLTFTVSLSKASGQTVTVNFATADGVARLASDYVAKTGTLTFAAGQTSRTVSIVINGDITVEGNESLFVLLSGAVNASISGARGIGTITNDDSSG